MLGFLTASGASVSGVFSQVAEGLSSMLSMSTTVATFVTGTGIVMIFLIVKLAPLGVKFLGRIIRMVKKG